MDLFSSEYGWSISYINNELDLYDEAKLCHAIYFRKGLPVQRKILLNNDYKESIKTYIDSLKPDIIDSNTELEGIIF